MDSAEPTALQHVAEQCVALVADQYGRRLDWTPDSLSDLDEVCALLLADGPLPAQRLDLWWKLIGAYAVSVHGLTALPFATAHRVLHGEPYKSLASFVRAMPAIVEHSRRTPDKLRPARPDDHPGGR
jgi:hypothetical protein